MGEILLFGDLNAKLEMTKGNNKQLPSPNGFLLQNVIDINGLTVQNKETYCKGFWTRVNRKNPDERSAIDYFITGPNTGFDITNMQIDEDENFVLKGRNNRKKN